MSLTLQQFKKVAILAARQADDKKADDIVLLDLRKSSGGLSDYVLIVSANSETHMHALSEYLVDVMTDLGLQHLHREGRGSTHWAILDYGGLFIHILHHESREFYALERLWENARQVEWQIEGAEKKKTARGKKSKKSSAKKTRKAPRGKKRSRK